MLRLGPLPEGCYCKPGRCMAPVIMGRQMPCRDIDKATATRYDDENGKELFCPTDTRDIEETLP